MANQMIISSDAKNLPAHLQNQSGAGNENVTANDMAIPTIKLLQDLSPETKKSRAEFVEGAKPGMYLNTLNNSLHDELTVLNLFYDHTYAVFRKRDFGGGFEGEFETEAAAIQHATQLGGGDAKMFEVVETGRHTLVTVDMDTGELQPAIFNMNSTKLRTSRRWNTELSQLGGDRFASAWKLSSAEESNAKGTWSSVRYSSLGWVNDELYQKAKELYESIRESHAKKKTEAASQSN